MKVSGSSQLGMWKGLAEKSLYCTVPMETRTCGPCYRTCALFHWATATPCLDISVLYFRHTIMPLNLWSFSHRGQYWDWVTVTEEENWTRHRLLDVFPRYLNSWLRSFKTCSLIPILSNIGVQPSVPLVLASLFRLESGSELKSTSKRKVCHISHLSHHPDKEGYTRRV